MPTTSTQTTSDGQRSASTDVEDLTPTAVTDLATLRELEAKTVLVDDTGEVYLRVRPDGPGPLKWRCHHDEVFTDDALWDDAIAPLHAFRPTTRDPQ